MAELYYQLAGASEAERRNIGQQLINAMGAPGNDGTPNVDYATLCETVLALHPEIPGNVPLSARIRGQFSAEGSIALIRDNPRRLQGYLGAIARAGPIETAIDAGCGAGAALAATIAAYNPDAQIVGYEVDAQAAGCAHYVVELLGLSRQIEIRAEDVMQAQLSPVDFAVTETFARALFQEQGVFIANRLGQVAQTILPAHVVLYATDIRDDGEVFLWKPAAEIDLRRDNRQIRGSFASVGAGKRDVVVYAGYYDEHGDAVLDVPFTDSLTKAVVLDRPSIPSPGTLVNFSYKAGGPMFGVHNITVTLGGQAAPPTR